MSAYFNSSDVVFHLFPGSASGFNAYSPLSVTLAVGGQTYGVETYSQNMTSGFTVAIFDDTFNPTMSRRASLPTRQPTAPA